MLESTLQPILPDRTNLNNSNSYYQLTVEVLLQNKFQPSVSS